MKVIVEKSYTLENVSHGDIESIVKALEYYKKSFMYEEFNDGLLGELKELVGACRVPVKTRILNSEDARDYLKRLRPFDTLMVPDELFPNCAAVRGNVCWYAMGKSKQLNISLWNSREAFDNKDKATLAFYINKNCAELLRMFISSDGVFAGNNVQCLKSGTLRILDTYLDSKGKVSLDKRFRLTFNTSDKTLIIDKDGSQILLSETEKICLEEFLLSHLEG